MRCTNPTRALCKLWLLATCTSASIADAAKAKTQRDKDTRPNIIFILAEDMGLGDLACYGHPYARTPNLDRLASEGTRFTRFYVAGATCNPSRTGFYTGRSPPTFPNYQADFGFPDNMPTITKLLHDDGYTTGHIGKWHIGPMDDNTHQTLGIDEIMVMGGSVNNPLGKDARVYEAAMEFIERNKDEPFYLNLWSHVAHSPIEPRESLVKEFKNVTVKRDDFDRYMQPKFDNAVKLGGENAVKIGMRRYLADLWGMDQMVGRLVDKLDALGIRDNTMLVFTADHGAAPIDLNAQSTPTSMMGWAGGLKGGKHTFYEGGLRVPFIISWPGRVPSGDVNDISIVSALDWLPSVCSIAQVSIDKTMFDGEDVSDIWLGEKRRSRKDPLFWRFNRNESVQVMLYENWKFFVTKQGEDRLYDLNRGDSAESDDRCKEEPEIADQMKQSLLQWERSLPSHYCNMKQGCELPIPFDGDTRPVYVAPPEILLADDAGATPKPPIDYVDEVSKEGIPPGLSKSTSPTKSPTKYQQESVSYDGEDLDELEGTPKPTIRPTTSGTPESTGNTAKSPTLDESTVSPTHFPTASKKDSSSVKNTDIDNENIESEEEWQQYEIAGGASEITLRRPGLSLTIVYAIASAILFCFD